ncbi:MAG TPA: class I SAM-dependent methyltransferase [Terriglobales bacterium]|nr:class I SAM-dependent methyltransferase [Terriglobales bacterium]
MDPVEESYDRVAEEYVRHLYEELRNKPADRELLDRFADRVRGKGITCDLGCGPGQVARYLSDRGLSVCGVDLSPEMVKRAGKLNPGIEFSTGDIRALDVPDGAWAGVAAFYAIVNLPTGDLDLALREMHRVLQPGGCLLLSFHLGEEVAHVEDLWGCPVSLDFYFRRTSEITDGLRAAGFAVEEITEREPYAPEIEYQSRRAYILARKPGLELKGDSL